MTLQELKYSVLLKLGVVAAGDAVAADDGATVIKRYNALHALLTETDLTVWGAEDDVPPELESPIVAMTAAECARDFGNADPILQAEGKFGLPQPSIAERTLRAVLATKYISSPAQPDYY